MNRSIGPPPACERIDTCWYTWAWAGRNADIVFREGLWKIRIDLTKDRPSRYDYRKRYDSLEAAMAALSWIWKTPRKLRATG